MRFWPSPIFWWSAFALWLGSTIALSSLPGNRIGEMPFPSADKVAHFGLYLAGGFVLTIALRLTLRRHWGVVVSLAIVLMLLLGIGDEIHQRFTPGRSGGDPGDVLADLIGASAGIITAALVFHAKFRPKTPLGAPRADRAS